MRHELIATWNSWEVSVLFHFINWSCCSCNVYRFDQQDCVKLCSSCKEAILCFLPVAYTASSTASAVRVALCRASLLPIAVVLVYNAHLSLIQISSILYLSLRPLVRACVNRLSTGRPIKLNWRWKGSRPIEWTIPDSQCVLQRPTALDTTSALARSLSFRPTCGWPSRRPPCPLLVRPT